jgi:hypothetical protein
LECSRVIEIVGIWYGRCRTDCGKTILICLMLLSSFRPCGKLSRNCRQVVVVPDVFFCFRSLIPKLLSNKDEYFL